MQYSYPVEGYLIDTIPKKGKIELILNGKRRAIVKTTYPVYVITENPQMVLEHPDVTTYYEENWRDLDGKPVNLYRFEVETMEAYNYIKERLNVVNEFPSILSQTLYRLKALPMHRIRVSERGIELLEEEGSINFPEITYAKVMTYDWYGLTKNGRFYELYVNGKFKESGDLRDLNAEADVIECMGPSCDKVSAIVKIQTEKKRSPVDVKGLIEWSKTTKVLLREIMYATIGKALTTNEAWVALRKKYIVPKIKINVEKARSLDELMDVDKGGLILFPKPGCYDKVTQVDFSSMYPSIIVKYNISGETVNKCDDITTEIGHTICLKDRGIVAEALEGLVKRKELLKKIDEERADAIKWILVASFGYLGYRNSKFGKIEAYELVTYFARKTLREAMKIAEEMGIEVIHGIIDSLTVRGDGIDEFIKKVTETTGIRLKVEHNYDWFIVTVTDSGQPYPQRYFGKLRDSKEVVSKGLIRSNMPNIVKDFLNNMLREMSELSTCEELREELPRIKNRLLKEYKRRAINGEPKDFVIQVKDKYLIRDYEGFYDVEKFGYVGHDPEYYISYIERVAGVFNVIYWI